VKLLSNALLGNTQMWLGKQFVQVVLLDISAQAELETTL